jgi:hypothetical protein
MTNPKIEKIKGEIEKTKAKVTEYQAKLRALEKQKTDLEDEQIVAIVRSEKISDAELNQLLASLLKKKAEPAKAAILEKTTRQEEERNANLNEN